MDLHLYQKKAANEAYLLNEHILLCDCGTGKTAIELAVINHRMKMNQVRRCLVVAPKSILWTAWEEDINKFYPDINYSIFWHKDMNKRHEIINNFDHGIGVINYEAISTCFHLLWDKSFDMIVLDESTRIKNPSSRTAKNIQSLSIGKKYKTEMTATPGWIPEHYFTQLLFLNIIENNFRSFRETFCYCYKLGNTGMKVWEPKTEMVPVLKGLLHKKAIRLSKSECLSLPDKVFCVRDIIIPNSAMHTYITLRDESIVTINDDTIICEFPITLRQKLRQVADGILYNNDITHIIHTEKMKELDYLININNSPIIIWANYKEIIKKIAEKYNALALYGDTVNHKQVIEDFKYGKNKIIVCHPRSAAHGITWTICNVQIYYSFPDSLELYLQTQDRNHRIGQERVCTYYILKSKNTVDDIIWRNLKINEDFQDDLLNYTKGVMNNERRI